MKKFLLVALPLLFFSVLGLYAAPLFSISPETALFAGGSVGVGIVLIELFAKEQAETLSLNYNNNIAARDSLRKAKDVLFNSMWDKFLDKTKGDERAAKMLGEDWVNNRKWSQSEVRLEVELNTQTSNFLFALTNNDQNTNGLIFRTEQRLDSQDTLVASEYGVFLGNPTSRDDTTYDVFSYANIVAFAAADIPGLRGTFFKNGSFYCTADKDVVIPYRGLIAHYKANQTQQTAALGAGSPQDQVDGSEDGYITAEPNFYLIGTKGYRPQIVMKTALTSLTNQFTRAIIIFRGNLAQNSTSFS